MVQAERKLIEGIRRLARRSRNRAVVRGIGDDCAVLKVTPGNHFLVTTDLCIEKVHFRREWHPADCVGHHCLARGLSDIAAMGGEPLACFLSLGLPATLEQRWADDFLKGFVRLGKRHGVQLAGGDTSEAHEITADIMVTGKIPAGKAVLRSGARPGDWIFVTGELGASAAVLRRLYAGELVAPSKANRQHFYPEPRLEAGLWLRRRGLATAMIDLSDGLSVDLAHICEESGVAAEVDTFRVPVARGADLDLALNGGEDYELLFTAGPKAKVPARIGGLKVTEIGRIKRRSRGTPAVETRSEIGELEPLEPRGWQHFTPSG